MLRTPRLQSLFAQSLDRSVFIAYFLGAVIPLVALAFGIQRYAMPLLEQDTALAKTVITTGIAIGVLSLSAFLALRRTVRIAVRRMATDNLRLSKIVEASEGLSAAPHAHEIAETVTRCAVDLVGARTAVFLLQSGASKPLSLTDSAGENSEELYDKHRDDISLWVESALRDGSPASIASGLPGRGDTGIQAAFAYPLGRAASVSGALVALRQGGEAAFSNEEIDALSTLGALTEVALQSADLQDAQRNFFAHVTDLLTTALDVHVDCRRGHSTAVVEVANRLGRELGIDDERRQHLHFASLLHDIGMLKIEPEQQRVPAYFQRHAQIGHRMISRIRLWQDVAPIVLHHHERMDGAGYPEGLWGKDIPMESRIIAVADAFDAMTREDNHRPAMTLEAALQEIRSCAGTQFDPDVVVAFAKLVERGEISADR